MTDTASAIAMFWQDTWCDFVTGTKQDI